MACTTHAPVSRAAIVGGKVATVGAVQRLGKRAHAQLLHGVREEADRPLALHAILAELRAVPATCLASSMVELSTTMRPHCNGLLPCPSQASRQHDSGQVPALPGTQDSISDHEHAHFHCMATMNILRSSTCVTHLQGFHADGGDDATHLLGCNQLSKTPCAKGQTSPRLQVPCTGGKHQP